MGNHKSVETPPKAQEVIDEISQFLKAHSSNQSFQVTSKKSKAFIERSGIGSYASIKAACKRLRVSESALSLSSSINFKLVDKFSHQKNYLNLLLLNILMITSIDEPPIQGDSDYDFLNQIIRDDGSEKYFLNLTQLMKAYLIFRDASPQLTHDIKKLLAYSNLVSSRLNNVDSSPFAGLFHHHGEIIRNSKEDQSISQIETDEHNLDDESDVRKDNLGLSYESNLSQYMNKEVERVKKARKVTEKIQSQKKLQNLQARAVVNKQNAFSKHKHSDPIASNRKDPKLDNGFKGSNVSPNSKIKSYQLSQKTIFNELIKTSKNKQKANTQKNNLNSNNPIEYEKFVQRLQLTKGHNSNLFNQKTTKSSHITSSQSRHNTIQTTSNAYSSATTINNGNTKKSLLTIMNKGKISDVKQAVILNNNQSNKRTSKSVQKYQIYNSTLNGQLSPPTPNKNMRSKFSVLNDALPERRKSVTPAFTSSKQVDLKIDLRNLIFKDDSANKPIRSPNILESKIISNNCESQKRQSDSSNNKQSNDKVRKSPNQVILHQPEVKLDKLSKKGFSIKDLIMQDDYQSD